jgi:hypothetical protein
MVQCSFGINRKSCRRIQNSPQHGHVTFQGTVLAKQSGSFRTRGPCRQNVIDKENAFSVHNVPILQRKGIGLISKTLTDRDAFLGTSLALAIQQMWVTRHLQRGGNFLSDNPRGIEVPENSLSPVLGNRDDSIDLQQLQFVQSLGGQQSSERTNGHRRK